MAAADPLGASVVRPGIGCANWGIVRLRDFFFPMFARFFYEMVFNEDAPEEAVQVRGCAFRSPLLAWNKHSPVLGRVVVPTFRVSLVLPSCLRDSGVVCVCMRVLGGVSGW